MPARERRRAALRYGRGAAINKRSLLIVNKPGCSRPGGTVGRWYLSFASCGISSRWRSALIRSEGWQIAVSDQHRLAARQQVPLRELRYEQVELWPRDMAPSYYDAVTTACRAAGFEPRLDADGAGSTV